jgi:UDP-3-O-[3-hydroxymyristoyl] glucosamine N-acyltransferase
MKDSEIVKELIHRYGNHFFNTTGSILKVYPNSLSFIKSVGYFSNLNNTENVKNVHVIIPKKLEFFSRRFKHIIFYLVDDVSYVFGELHNHIHNFTKPIENDIHSATYIHPTACLDVEGIHLYHMPSGYKRQLKHLSNVKIGKHSRVGPNTVIHKGVFNSTVIGEYVTIGSLVNILTINL